MKRLRARVAGLSACLALVAGAARAADADVSLIFVGDVMLDDGPGRLIAAGGDPLAKVAPLLAGADYRIANLECSVSTRGQGLPGKPYAFRASPDALRVMQGRFDAVAVANNHSGDFGSEAFVDTLEHARRAGIQAFGGGRNLREAHAPLWIHRNGLRIAVLAYNEYKPRSFEAGASRPGVAWSEDDEVISDIRAARKAGAHIVIPFMHWGWEGRPVPSLRQRALARRMIDAGASLVVGGHPHVIQDAELYRGRLIVYSLGNFVFDGFDLPEERQGWLLRLELDRRGLKAWQTRLVQIDAAGTPAPVNGAVTPCGARGTRAIGLCSDPDGPRRPESQ